MNAAKLSRSPRLQRVLSALWPGEWLTTRDIIRRANVCAVNSCIAELKAPINGFVIECKRVSGVKDGTRFAYRLIHG